MGPGPNSFRGKKNDSALMRHYEYYVHSLPTSEDEWYSNMGYQQIMKFPIMRAQRGKGSFHLQDTTSTPSLQLPSQLSKI
jgi:hypothetical protein